MNRTALLTRSVAALAVATAAGMAHAELKLSLSPDYTQTTLQDLQAHSNGILVFTLLSESTMWAQQQTFSINGNTAVFAGADSAGAVSTAIAGPLNSVKFDSHVGTQYAPGGQGDIQFYRSNSAPNQFILAYEDYTPGGTFVDYNDMVVGLSVSAVPEPQTIALLIAGLSAVAFVSRRRKA